MWTAKNFSIGLIILLGGRTVLQLRENHRAPARLEAEEHARATGLRRSHIQQMHTLESEFREKIHMASGGTVFDRVYNRPGQSIKELLANLAREAYPDAVHIDVQAEEFTSFLLMVYMPPSFRGTNTSRLVDSAAPIARYAGDYLTSIAFYDRYRKSFLFFDEIALRQIKTNGTLADQEMQLARERGKHFSKFNSISVEGTYHQSHLILPLGITGSSGSSMTGALLDTGASITMISSEIFHATGFEDLARAPTRRFQTVNGVISAPIVRRTVSLGDMSRTIDVAVNTRDDLILIGMNLFEGYEYLIESQKSMIHLWPKSDQP